MKRILLFLGVILMVMTACQQNSNDGIEKTPIENEQSQIDFDEEQEKPIETDEDDTTKDVESDNNGENIEDDHHSAVIRIEDVDLSLNPNEAGRIMVLMYHSIGEKDNAWEITPDSFRKDLEYMYENKYRPISLEKVIKGEIDTPAGYTPIVLTFDDGNQNNFNMIEVEGEWIIDPDSALGIMEYFNEKYEDFNVTATFYLFGENPFRQKEWVEYKLKYLVDHGYDIGNHTYSHANLANLESPEAIQRELAKMVEGIQGFLPDYTMTSFAITYGISPRDEWKQYMVKGEYDGTAYSHLGLLEVGAHPSFSPYDYRFNALSIPRIRGSNTAEPMESADWFLYFEENPDRRFISDGFTEIITLPETMLELIDEKHLENRMLLTY